MLNKKQEGIKKGGKMTQKFKSEIGKNLEGLATIGVTEAEEKELFKPYNLSRVTQYDVKIKRLEQIGKEIEKATLGQYSFPMQVYFSAVALLTGRTPKEVADKITEMKTNNLSDALQRRSEHYKKTLEELNKKRVEFANKNRVAGLVYDKYNGIIEQLKIGLREYEKQRAEILSGDGDEYEKSLKVASIDVEIDKIMKNDLPEAENYKKKAALEKVRATTVLKVLEDYEAGINNYLTAMNNKIIELEVAKIKISATATYKLDPVGAAKVMRDTTVMVGKADNLEKATHNHTKELMEISIEEDSALSFDRLFEDNKTPAKSINELGKSKLDDLIARIKDEERKDKG